jgi:hypothetical protein
VNIKGVYTNHIQFKLFFFFTEMITEESPIQFSENKYDTL